MNTYHAPGSRVRARVPERAVAIIYVVIECDKPDEADSTIVLKAARYPGGPYVYDLNDPQLDILENLGTVERSERLAREAREKAQSEDLAARQASHISKLLPETPPPEDWRTRAAGGDS